MVHDRHSPARSCASSWLSDSPSVAPHTGGAFATLLSLAALGGSDEFSAVGQANSISLRPFAPPALPGFHATMDALTPVRPALRAAITESEHRPVPHRAPGFMYQAFLTSCLQPPGVPDRRFSRCRSPFSAADLHNLPSTRRKAPGFVVVVWASPLGCRLAAATRPNRVRFSTGRQFTSSCSPPHLMVTQLPSLTGLRARPEGTCTP